MGNSKSRNRMRRIRAMGAWIVVASLALTAGLAQEYTQAPALDPQVESGELPAVAERLPANPRVLEPIERIGTYGGTWNIANLGVGGGWRFKSTGYDQLVSWIPETRDFSIAEIVPNVAGDFEYNDDATEYTFRLREGLKWSDGQPFTADDILFWYEDVLMNEDITPAVPAWLSSGGEPVVVEKVDDYTVVFRFAEPNGLFLQNLAAPQGQPPTHYPRHYMEAFHADYNDDVVADAQAAGFENWTNYFATNADLWVNGDKPTLLPWKLTEDLAGGATQIVMERNPYYWKVDPEGNQLPYIDRVVYDIVQDNEVMVLKALSGEIDMQDNWINALQNKPLYFDNLEQANLRFFSSIPTFMNTITIMLNLTIEDPVKREVFQNRDFRIGLSHAINRQEIIDLVYVGQGEPWQAAPRPESAFHDEEFAKQYTEYDVELANQYLDQVLPERDAQGWRLGPDGNRFVVTFEITDVVAEHIDMMELVQQYWADVGIQIELRPISREIYRTRQSGNQLEGIVWDAAGGLDVILSPRYYFPFDTAASNFAIPWAQWFNDPSDPRAMEPPPAAKEQMELYSQLTSTADPDEQAALMTRILEIAKEQFWVMGVSLPVEGYGIVKENFRNVPEAMLESWNFPDPGPTQPAQYFIEGDDL